MRHPSLPDAPFDIPSSWKWRRRGFLNGLVVALVLALLIEGCGLPHVAWEYRCHGGTPSLERAFAATYYGPLGRLDLAAGEYGPGVTFVKWVPLDPPLSCRARLAAQVIASRLTAWWSGKAVQWQETPWEAPL